MPDRQGHGLAADVHPRRCTAGRVENRPTAFDTRPDSTIYVLAGRQTFSAAQTFASALDALTDAVFDTLGPAVRGAMPLGRHDGGPSHADLVKCTAAAAPCRCGVLWLAGRAEPSHAKKRVPVRELGSPKPYALAKKRASASGLAPAGRCAH